MSDFIPGPDGAEGPIGDGLRGPDGLQGPDGLSLTEEQIAHIMSVVMSARPQELPARRFPFFIVASMLVSIVILLG